MVNISNINFSGLDMNQSLLFVLDRVHRRQKTTVVTPNAEIAYQCRRNKALLDTVNSADLILPDGVGIIYASKILKTRHINRIPGIDFASAVLDRAAADGLRIFLLGAKPGVSEKAAENLENKFKGLIVCGTCDGYFKNQDDVVQKINGSNADIVFVCLGFPKQEQFMKENRNIIDAPMMIGLGGSLDVFAGNVKRAPKIFIKLGLEWLYRLLTQPSRFFRMLRLPLFLIDIFHDKIFKKDR